MWSDFRDNGTANQVIMPNEGIIGVTMPTGSEICAYVNDNVAPMHHLHVRAGDRVHFEIKKYPETPGNLTLQFDGRTFTLPVPEVVSGKTDYKEIESVVVSHDEFCTFVQTSKTPERAQIEARIRSEIEQKVRSELEEKIRKEMTATAAAEVEKQILSKK